MPCRSVVCWDIESMMEFGRQLVDADKLLPQELAFQVGWMDKACQIGSEDRAYQVG